MRAAISERSNSFISILFFILALKSASHGLNVILLKTQSKACFAKGRCVALKIPKIEKMIKARKQNIKLNIIIIYIIADF